MAGNILRGALGSALRRVVCEEDYSRLFAPAASRGPSGLSDPPRPFVIRGAAMNGRTVQPGESFCFGLNLFNTSQQTLEQFTRAFASWADLLSVEHSSVTVDLMPRHAPVSRLRVDFQTPTDLKGSGECAGIVFAVLLARARDRISALRSLYGPGPLDIDFRALAERARFVQPVRSELHRVPVQRRSSRTGQRHGIGGLIGFAEYEGDLAEFVPYLEAASWTGVGRHCTWGNGEILTAGSRA
jgi:hypothetical protein